MQRLFSELLSEIRNLNGISTKTFKINLNEWLKTVPDEPRINNYAMDLTAEKKQHS